MCKQLPCFLLQILFFSTLFTSSANAGVPLFCQFTSTTTPCSSATFSGLAVSDPSGVFGNALRICKGAGCASSSILRLAGKPLSLHRGSVAFWFKTNSNTATSGPTEIFNTYPGSPYIISSFTNSFLKSSTAVFSSGSLTSITLVGHGYSTGDTIRLSGATGAWSGLNADWTITKVDEDHFTVSYNSSVLGAFTGSLTALNQGQLHIRYLVSAAGNSKINLNLDSDKFFMVPGQWTHFVWTWSGQSHTLYRNGSAVSSEYSLSAFSDTATFNLFYIGTSSGGNQDISIDDFGSYGFTATPNEVNTLYTAGTSQALTATDTHGVIVGANWGPGEKKVDVTIDAGSDYAATATRFIATVKKDGVALNTQQITPRTDGFAQAILDVSDFNSGNFVVSVSAYNGATLLQSVDSTTLAFTKPAWLGNSYGIDSTVPSNYWNPVTQDTTQLALNVVGRKYLLSGGYGLPTQMNSLGQDLLQGPLSLEVVRDGNVTQLTSPTIQVDSLANDKATWSGSVQAGTGLSISTVGTLEYDGMILVTLRLQPTAGPVALDRLTLKTTLPSSRARYLFAQKDQPFWWYTYSVRPPTTAGEFNNNLSSNPVAAATNNIFEVVFSDEDRGLEIFHNNMAGWMIDQTRPWQRFIRETSGAVSYAADLINAPVTITSARDITVGFMATPVKKLPSGWRLATGGAYGGSRAPESNFEYRFEFANPHWASTFGLFPTNTPAFRAFSNQVRSSNVKYKIKVLPFVNAHVLISNSPYSTWNEITTLNSETLNDGWNASPSRGLGDYWAYAINTMINDSVNPNVIDGYYIDESYGYLPNSSLLTGAGYTQPDGTQGVGINLLGARDQFKRMAKILVNAGKEPNLWFHTTSSMYPHVWSHGMMTFDGERPNSGVSYYIDADSAASPDHFDTWNNNNSLIDETQGGNGTWLRGISASRKFGFIPSMWSGIECCSKPAEAIKIRRAMCLYQMHDMIQQDQPLSWWQTKYDWGIGDDDVAFQGYDTQSTLLISSPMVKASLYRKPNSVLAYVANFSASDYSGSVSIKPPLGMRAISAQDAESKSPLTIVGATVPVTVKSHDCQIVSLQFVADTLAPAPPATLVIK